MTLRLSALHDNLHDGRHEMSKIVTAGGRYLKDDRWHDDNGPLPDTPLEWDPPMTDEEVLIAVRSDPDAQPLTEDQLGRLRRVPLAKHIRWKLGLSQAELARRYRIPLGTLRDWEQGRTVPEATAEAYLAGIKAEPELVARAIERIRQGEGERAGVG